MVSTKHLLVGQTVNGEAKTTATDSLNSAGSEEGSVCTMGSTSDLHTESLSTSNEFMSKGTPSPIHRMEKLRNGVVKVSNGNDDESRLTPTDTASGATVDTRPNGCATDSSSSDAAMASTSDSPELSGCLDTMSVGCMHVMHDMSSASRPMSEASSVW